MKSLVAIFRDLSSFRIEYRTHATRRMFQRGIMAVDVEGVVREGEIVEVYKDDYPLPSFLLKGQTVVKQPLHVVVGVNAGEKVLVIITAYIPDQGLWTNDFTRRKV